MQELITRALALVDERARRDPRLAAHIAYPRFTLRVNLTLVPWDQQPIQIEESFDDVTRPASLRREMGLPQIETVQGLDRTWVDRKREDHVPRIANPQGSDDNSLAPDGPADAGDSDADAGAHSTTGDGHTEAHPGDSGGELRSGEVGADEPAAGERPTRPGRSGAGRVDRKRAGKGNSR